jgi:hypothetical protein
METAGDVKPQVALILYRLVQFAVNGVAFVSFLCIPAAGFPALTSCLLAVLVFIALECWRELIRMANAQEESLRRRP